MVVVENPRSASTLPQQKAVAGGPHGVVAHLAATLTRTALPEVKASNAEETAADWRSAVTHSLSPQASK